MTTITQKPEAGKRMVRHTGDTVVFELHLAEELRGRAYLRTTLGRAAMARREIVDHVEKGEPFAARDWHDIRMRKISERIYRVTLPLTEVGNFKAKCLFLGSDSDQPLWPDGDNTDIKVEPAAYYASNTIYSAFVRQFGPNKHRREEERFDPEVEKLEDKGYTVIPPSGKFRDLAGELDFIIGRMGFRIIQLLPIHPVPTTYARMGRFGSPFAALDLMAVDPALADFDQSTTPLGQFRELTAQVHARGARLFLDMPINHTGWASKMQNQHPEWFARDENDAFESPGAWGITWEDLVKLSYRNLDLWKYVADVFLFWCRQGVDGFRCDAGYMLPFMVWEYVAAKVRQEYADTIFILEGLGGKIETTEALIGEAGLNWAYSELFQNYDRQQIETYLPLSTRISDTRGLLVHFSETHDNNRLAARSRVYSRMRNALSALCSRNGAFAITNGVEWFADKKIDVHGAPPLNWGADENQVELIRRLNDILESHPAFRGRARLRLIHSSQSNTVALLREMEGEEENDLLVLANLDCENDSEVWWNSGDFGIAADSAWDLVSGERQDGFLQDNGYIGCWLGKGEVRCIARTEADVRTVEDASRLRFGSRACMEQSTRAKALEIISRFAPKNTVEDIDLEEEAHKLVSSPAAFCRRWKPDASAGEVVSWQWPGDSRRVVMLPAGGAMVVKSDYPFAAGLMSSGHVLQREHSIETYNDGSFAVFFSEEQGRHNRDLVLAVTVFEEGRVRESRSPVLQLSAQVPEVATSVTRDELVEKDAYALCTNGKGAMAQVRGRWGEIRSQYDAMLAANLDPSQPTDPHVMLTRCRVWIVNQGYWQEMNFDFTENFARAEDRSALWTFRLPCGRGRFVNFAVKLEMIDGENSIRLTFRRRLSGSRREAQPENLPVDVIVRPDIEDRRCHEKTKAYQGPEKLWPRAVDTRSNGFLFVPHDDRKLDLESSEGSFTLEPEWTYMVPHPLDGERGLDDCSDLFSPGYFKFGIHGGQTVTICASVNSSAKANLDSSMEEPPAYPPRGMQEIARESMRDFVVDRNGLKTVIAGYPWFLDWGRDTLICLRGMIAAGMLEEAGKILRQFAAYESNGTLPNVIYGADASNRDTSDAPLWFIVAVCDHATAAGNEELLDTSCNGRTVRDVVVSIIQSYISGTGNGIAMDDESCLVFSPRHFTWMDTNYPAGTPREGYPVEIQALWYASLRFAAAVAGRDDFRDLAERAKSSVVRYFWERRYPATRWLADCLHAKPGESAGQARPDDALRPNQLLAVTLGAVDDATLMKEIISSCAELAVPGAMRSLADRHVEYPIPVRHSGQLLNDPRRPYWPFYSGDEDTRRKPAYHNGTAWSWLFPSYCEAIGMCYGPGASSLVRGLLGSFARVIEEDCLGHVPEILDGDRPHRAKGCGAQAWGATELYRILARYGEN